jgi:hypothetical protein
MIIEKLITNDIQYISEFQPEGWPEITPVFQFYTEKSFCCPIKVLSNNRIIGIGSGISFRNTAWLAHIIVNPGFRKKGIGTEIVNYLCNYLKGNGIVSVSLNATELGYPLYKKAGFIEQSEYVFFERDDVLANQISENIFDLSNHDIEDVIFLDKKISGEDRTIVLKENFKNSYVYKKNNKLIGFYLPELGEGLIIANDIEAGIELMKLRYLKVNKGVLPVDNFEGIKFLKDNGFKETRRAKRMICGEKFEWNSSKLFNRIAGNLG